MHTSHGCSVTHKAHNADIHNPCRGGVLNPVIYIYIYIYIYICIYTYIYIYIYIY